MTELIFAFDTEDFTSEAAADAILREAQIMERAGVTACFNLVGLLAKQLENWGRTDILHALKKHELGCHTYGHTLHPMLNEYTDIEDFEQAKREVLRQEREALQIIDRVTGGQKVYAACPPGNQKSYVGMYAYHALGLPLYADTFCDTMAGDGAYYCNIYQMRYTFCMEELMSIQTQTQMQTVLDELAKNKRAIVYAHPNCAIFREYWDEVNYRGRNLYPFGQWKQCAKRPVEETERYYQKIEAFVRMVQQDGRFAITSYSAVAAKLQAEKERVIRLKDIPALRKQIENSFYPVSAPASLCLSDLFLACRDLLTGKTEHHCGEVFGFLDAPEGITQPVTVSAEGMKKSAAELPAEGFLPTQITVDGALLGAGDWLRAALQVLCGVSEAHLLPQPQLPSLDELPEVRDCSLKGTWMHSSDFEDRYLSHRLRLQSWTLRF